MLTLKKQQQQKYKLQTDIYINWHTLCKFLTGAVTM